MADITKFTTNKQAKDDKKARQEELEKIIASGQDQIA